MNIKDLTATEYAPIYSGYLSQIDDQWDLIEELEVNVHAFIKFVQDIPMDKFDYRYAEGKWTIKEIIQHLIDTERIFAYRALRFARNDSTELPGYEENAYAAAVNADGRNLQVLLTEMALVRQCTIALYKSFTKEDLLKGGIASGNRASVRAIGFIIIGHQNHHMKIFRERYMN
jgi:uncharacterized damage-inducible protein DinB